MLLSKNIISRSHFDIYARCISQTMTLFTIEKLNEIQQKSVNYLRNLLNEIDLIIESIVIEKIAFLERIVQSFLLSSTRDNFETSDSKTLSNHTFSSLQRLFFTIFEIDQIKLTSSMTFIEIITLENISNRKQSRVLMCTSNNETTNELTKRVFERASVNSTTRNAIIIRAYSMSTEIEVIEARTRSLSSHDSSSTIDENLKSFLLTIFSMLYEAFQTTQTR